MISEQLKRSYGVWYTPGQLQESSGQALCFRPHARSGPTCYAFRLDTVATSPVRRRLTVFGYRGNHSIADRVLVERAS